MQQTPANLVRIVPFRKGIEGQGLTYYALMQVNTGMFMSSSGAFAYDDVHDKMVVGYNSLSETWHFIRYFQLELDKHAELLVRMNGEGTELTKKVNALVGAYFQIEGDLVNPREPALSGRHYIFFVPASVYDVQLYFSSKYDWSLIELKPGTMEPTGRGWFAWGEWPHNEFSVQI